MGIRFGSSKDVRVTQLLFKWDQSNSIAQYGRFSYVRVRKLILWSGVGCTHTHTCVLGYWYYPQVFLLANVFRLAKLFPACRQAM